MNNTTTTFLNFIQHHSIQIPLIQRDYVQGLALTDKSREKRDEFVEKLLNALLPNNQAYTLDFIYGARESYDGESISNDAPFLPLDGQQRLTTLFILHWLLAEKTQNNTIIELLKKFSYKTRITSDKFCRRLLSATYNDEKPLYDQVKDKTWYVSMETDPTVKAVMEMVKQMEITMESEPYKTMQKEMARLLFDEEEHRITFSLLDMERYHLTDGLYVKMNARGKELTTFENWKADFINLISDNSEEKERFTQSIEHSWNDLFWKDVYRQYANELKNTPSEKDRLKIKYPRIDEHFMNFFTNFSRLYFFSETSAENPKVEDFNGKVWSTTESLYGGNSILRDKLFETLDTLVKIDEEEGVGKFFEELFYTNPSTNWSDHIPKVKIFEGHSINFFKKSFTDESFDWHHVMLYALIIYCAKHGVYKVTDNLRTYARICRNYLFQHNYLNTGEVKIVPQIRVVDMKTYDKVFDYLSTYIDPIESLKREFSGEDSKYLEIERNKMVYYECNNSDVTKLLHKLEDMSYCYGYTEAFNNVLKKCVDGVLSCSKVWDAIYSFRNATDVQKAQLFVALGYKGMAIGNDCAYGKRIFIGEKDRWGVHFRKGDDTFAQWISDYVDAYIKWSDVAEIISIERDEISDNPQNMRDYMLKYESVIAAKLPHKAIPPFYFAMPNPWKDMDAIVIHSFSSRPLGNSYQTCPMANAVAQRMSNYDVNKMGYAGQGSCKNGIMIHNGDWSKIIFSMYFSKKEWCIEPQGYELLSTELQQRIELVNVGNADEFEYRLLPIHGLDLIENGVGFMERVVDYFKDKNII